MPLPNRDRTSVSFSIDKELIARLDTEAEARVVGRNLLVEKALEFYLDRLPDVRVDAEDRPSEGTSDPSGKIAP